MIEIKDKKLVKYIVYALEEYKKAHRISGYEVTKLFNSNDVYSFIIDNYEALHTGSSENLVKDIDEYVK